MDLHSGLPFWIIKNALYAYFNPLKRNIKTKVVVIGSGITGSLVAHELCKNNVDTVVIDKRSIGLGSTAASTSQLQYEIDTPLCELIEKVGEANAVAAYKDCLKSIDDLEQILKEANVSGDFVRVPTVLFASNQQGLNLLENEYNTRLQHDLPVDFLTSRQLGRKLGIDKLGALYNNTSAQIDCYKASVGILDYHLKQAKHLRVYSHTLVQDYKRHTSGYTLQTEAGHTIECEYVVIAAGFEAGEFLPKKVMDLLSTYAIISRPMPTSTLWRDRALIWETQEPYLYMRTTADNRIIVGGEDVDFESPQKRDQLLDEKSLTLEKKFKTLFPNIPFVTEMGWCGTFSATKDGLPYIGAWPRIPNMLFALGYGGNGITFSVIAAQVISKIVRGRDDDERLVRYGFGRKSC